MTKNLFETFHGNEVDQSELEQLLLAHFGGCHGVAHDEVHYVRRGASDPLLVVKYDANGRLLEMLPSDSLDAAEISVIAARVESDLLSFVGPQIGQVVLFADSPTSGWFRYRDVFQLLPVPPEAPRPGTYIGGHPLLLQYQVVGSADAQSGSLEQALMSTSSSCRCREKSMNESILARQPKTGMELGSFSSPRHRTQLESK